MVPYTWAHGGMGAGLSLATVERGGLSPWNGGCKFIADTLKPETLGAFDRAYGSRKAWEADLVAVRDMIRQS